MGGRYGRTGGRFWAPLSSGPLCPLGQVEVIGGADKYHAVCRLCYFQKTSGQPAGLGNKENCPVGKPGEPKPGEAAGTRKPLAPHQILQCVPAN